MIWKLERVLEIELNTVNKETLEFRLELFSVCSTDLATKFKTRLFRYETFNTEPAFEVDPEFKRAFHIWAILDPQDELIPAGILSVDDAISWYVDRLSKKLDITLSLN